MWVTLISLYLSHRNKQTNLKKTVMKYLKEMDQDTFELLILVILPIGFVTALVCIFPEAFSIY